MRIDLHIPESWRELNVRDMIYLVRIQSLTLTREEFLLLLFSRFSRIRYLKTENDLTWFTKKRQRFCLSSEQVMVFCSRLAWILDTEPRELPCPIGVHPKLYDLSFEKYFNAEALFARYNSTKEERYLKKAVFALSWRFTGRKRRQAALMWWSGVRLFLRERYPYVFQSGEAEGVSPFDTLQDILLGLNETRPQDNKEILKSEVHFVLSALNHKISIYAKHK